MSDTNEQHVDEDSGILVEEFLKMTDPETGDVIYEGRA